MSKRHTLSRTVVAFALAMTVPVAASHADSGSKGDSSGSSTSQSGSARTGKSASAASETVSVTAPVTKADGTKVVTAHKVSTGERKTALASGAPTGRAAERDAAARKAVREYWTRERLASAKPMPLPSGPKADKSSLRKGAAKAEQTLKADKAAGKTTRVNGKVFFNDDRGGKYECSASAVDSPTKRIVVTAAHCVYAGKNKYFSNWMFIPGYDNGNKPYGTFQAQHFHVLQDYIHRGNDAGSDWNSDVAFVTTKDSEQGKRLVDAVGGHKVVTGKTTEFNATIFGYPHNIDKGLTLQTCSKMTKDTWANRKYHFHTVTGCNLKEGASGGPWLENYNEKTGVGEIRTVTSFGSETDAYLGGPRFDDRAKKLFEEANSDK